MNANNTAPKRAIGYLRVSTQEQSRRRNGLDSQQRDIKSFCEANEIELIECVVEVSSGANNLDKRTLLAGAIDRCKAEGLILMVSRLDRYSRDMQFVATSLNEFIRRGVKFVSCQQGMNAEMFTLHIYASLAQREREDISTRTKKGLESVKVRGVTKTGRVATDNGSILGVALHSDGGAKARAAAKAALVAKADAFALSMKPLIEPMRTGTNKMTFKQIAERLNMHNTPTAAGGKWSVCSVRNICMRWD